MNIYLQVKDFILTVISNKWHSYFHARICSGFILKLHLLEIVLPIKKINKPLHMYDTTREINQKLQNLQPHFPTIRCLEQWDTMDSSCISDRPRISPWTVVRLQADVLIVLNHHVIFMFAAEHTVD